MKKHKPSIKDVEYLNTQLLHILELTETDMITIVQQRFSTLRIAVKQLDERIKESKEGEKLR